MIRKRVLRAALGLALVAATATATADAAGCPCDPVAHLVPVAQPRDTASSPVTLPEARAIARVLGWQLMASFADRAPTVRVHCKRRGDGALCTVRAYGDRAAVSFRVRMTQGPSGLSVRSDRLRSL